VKTKANYIYLQPFRLEIKKVFGVDERTVSKHVRNMSEFGFIRDAGHGQYELIQDPESDIARRVKELQKQAEEEAKEVFKSRVEGVDGSKTQTNSN